MSETRHASVEAAVDTFADALAAEHEGCTRIELCGPLTDGGTTPSAGLIAQCVKRLSIEVHVLVRPRTGSFVYDADDLAIMRTDIEAARDIGATGVVTGALSEDGAIDVPAMRELAAAARPMRIGFHRAFDATSDQIAALEAVISLGIDHVLTSGGAGTAAAGSTALRQLIDLARDRTTIVAGGSITPANVRDLVDQTGVTIVHGRAFRGMPLALLN